MAKRMNFFGLRYPLLVILGPLTYMVPTLFVAFEIMGNDDYTPMGLPREEVCFVFNPFFILWLGITTLIAWYIWHRRLCIDLDLETLRIRGKVIPISEIENICIENRLEPKDLAWKWTYKEDENNPVPALWSQITFSHGGKHYSYDTDTYGLNAIYQLTVTLDTLAKGSGGHITESERFMFDTPKFMWILFWVLTAPIMFGTIVYRLIEIFTQ